jgi:hypothetical protein
MRMTAMNRIRRWLRTFQEDLEAEIMATPTGPTREKLTEANILVGSALMALSEAVVEEHKRQQEAVERLVDGKEAS